MFEGDLALMIPIVAVVAWSPIGKAIAASIYAVADEMQAKADRTRGIVRARRPHFWDALGQGTNAVLEATAARIHPGAADPSRLPEATGNEVELAERVKALEEEIHHLREAAVMSPWSSRTPATPSGQNQTPGQSRAESETSPERRVAQ